MSYLYWIASPPASNKKHTTEIGMPAHNEYYNKIIGVGGGSLADWSKLLGLYFNVPVFFFPSSMSTNAPLVYKIALRDDQHHKYSLNGKPCETVYFDYSFMSSTKETRWMNKVGWGDIISCCTAFCDWKRACTNKKDIIESPEKQNLYQTCFSKTQKLLWDIECAINRFEDDDALKKGIQFLGGAEFLGGIEFLVSISDLVNQLGGVDDALAGRIDAGCEHQFAFSIEKVFPHHRFLHGHIVTFATLVMILLYKEEGKRKGIDIKDIIASEELIIKAITLLGLWGDCRTLWGLMNDEDVFVNILLQTRPKVGRYTIIDDFVEFSHDEKISYGQSVFSELKGVFDATCDYS